MPRRSDDDPSMRCHLGDVPDGLEHKPEPYRFFYEEPPQTWIDWLKNDFVAWVAAILAVGLAILIVWLLLQFAAQPSLAAESISPEEKQVRQDCKIDALKYCKKAIFTLDRNIIIQCMLANRDKLKPVCAAWLH